MMNCYVYFTTINNDSTNWRLNYTANSTFPNYKQVKKVYTMYLRTLGCQGPYSQSYDFSSNHV